MEINKKINCTVLKSYPDNLLNEWNEFWNESKSECVFNSPGWFVSAQKAFNYKKMRILVLRDGENNSLVGILPLIRTRVFGTAVYTLPGIEFVDHYSLLIKKEKSIIDVLANCILSLGFVYIPGVLMEDSNYLISNGYSKSFVLDDNPYIKTGDEFEKVLNKKNNNRHFKKAQKDFGLINLRLNDVNKESALNDAIMIERESSKSKKGKTIFNNKKNQTFFKELTKEIGDNLFIASLFFSDKPIAYNIGFICNGVYACSQKAHLKAYDKYRPGGLMFLKFLEAVNQKSTSEVDIGRGMDSFKMEYANGVRKLYGVIISYNKIKRYYFIFMYNLGDRMYRLINSNVYLYVFYKGIKDMISFY